MEMAAPPQSMSQPAQIAMINQEQLDADEVSRLDLTFQAAVKRNDAAQIDAILHPTFFLVLGDGRVVTREQLIDEARSKSIEYDIQDEYPDTQTVRVWGDTAVVTAKLRIKGRSKGKIFDRSLWFSDTYVRTAQGWRYAFAQASSPLPDEDRAGSISPDG